MPFSFFLKNLFPDTFQRMEDKYIIFYNHTSIVSGAEISLIEMLKEIKDENVLLACPCGELSKIAEKEGIRVVPAPHVDVGLTLNPLSFITFVVCALRVSIWLLTLQIPIRVVYANSIRGALGLLPAVKFRRVKLVVQIRDVFDFHPLKSIIRFLLLKFAEILVFNSEFTRDRFMDDKLSHKCRILYSPCNYKFFKEVEEKGLVKGDVYPLISVVGQITPWKRQDFAINVMRYIKSRYANPLLLVVGDVRFSGKFRRYDNTVYFKELLENVRKNNLDTNVVFMGFRSDVNLILAQSDVLFLPSINEPFGRVVAESLAVGTPVIVCSEGGMGRIIKERRAGYIFDKDNPPEEVAESIISMLEDADERKERVIRGMVFAFEHLTPFAIVDRLMEILSEI